MNQEFLSPFQSKDIKPASLDMMLSCFLATHQGLYRKAVSFPSFKCFL